MNRTFNSWPFSCGIHKEFPDALAWRTVTEGKTEIVFTDIEERRSGLSPRGTHTCEIGCHGRRRTPEIDWSFRTHRHVNQIASIFRISCRTSPRKRGCEFRKKVYLIADQRKWCWGRGRGTDIDFTRFRFRLLGKDSAVYPVKWVIISSCCVLLKLPELDWTWTYLFTR